MRWAAVWRLAGRAAAALGLAGLLLYAAGLLALRLLGFDFAVVMSDSMRPTFARGDLVLLRPPATPAARDIVMFRRGEVLVLHRLVWQSPAGRWQTRGDANPAPDPWLVSSGELLGRAVGALHGLGHPLLWLQLPAAAAGWTDTGRVENTASARYWQSPTMAWTIYANSSYITPIAPSQLSITGSGDRRVYAATRFPADSRWHLEARLTQTDSGAGWALLFNACAGSNDALSCGWLVNFHNSTRAVSLHTITANRSRSQPLAACTWPAGISLTNSTTVSVQRVGNRILVLVAGWLCLNVTDAPALAVAAGLSVPAGNHTGLWLAGSNRLAASKAVVW